MKTPEFFELEKTAQDVSDSQPAPAHLPTLTITFLKCAS